MGYHIGRIIMRASIIVILAAIACALLVVAGCTNSSGTLPATPDGTTAAAEPSLAAVTTVPPAPEIPSWSGTWNTSYSSNTGDVIVEMTIAQDGSSVTGTYNKGLGTIVATAQGNKISGTWRDSDNAGVVYTGFFEFTKSTDDKSFTGIWVSTDEGAGAMKTTTQYWNGARV
jgi:hypothetical protein